MDLTQKHCIPCEGNVPALTADEAAHYLGQLSGWQDQEKKKISKEFKYKDFPEAMRFVGEVAKIAEAEGHHPDIYIFYNLVRLELWTHAANGLTENDFVLAAKIDAIRM